MRKTEFAVGEFYHIYNRGVDKREIFMRPADMARFFRSMEMFNMLEPIGSIHENYYAKKKFGGLAAKSEKSGKLVNFVCYCLNPNHFHFILEQVAEKGIEKFMHRLSTGYTCCFNLKYKRSGGLFQGTYKAIHINSNEYLLHLSVYVNLNNEVHNLGLGGLAAKSSWGEYSGSNKLKKLKFCSNKEAVLGQFKNGEDYAKFARRSLESIKERKKMQREMEEYYLEA